MWVTRSYGPYGPVSRSLARALRRRGGKVKGTHTALEGWERQAVGTTETIEHIERELRMAETFRVTTFEGIIREDADGGSQEITVEVLEPGSAPKPAARASTSDSGTIGRTSSATPLRRWTKPSPTRRAPDPKVAASNPAGRAQR